MINKIGYEKVIIQSLDGIIRIELELPHLFEVTITTKNMNKWDKKVFTLSRVVDILSETDQ
jgi:hypothetical protein